MQTSLAYLNGQFLPQADAHLPLHDAGFVFGATVTDLCRTFNHKLFRLADHLTRFRRSCQYLRIHPALSDAELTQIAEELVTHNAGLLRPEQDLALVMFATPGPVGYYAGLEGGPGDDQPTLGMHTFPLPFARYRRLMEHGAHLVVPATRHVPAACVDPRVKQRSRLHWWLAEQEVHGTEPGSIALLLDTQDHLTETAGANFLLVKEGIVVSPPSPAILGGISLQMVRELCDELAIRFEERPLRLDDALTAEEAFLSSTSYCLTGVSQINGLSLPWPGPIFQRLLAAWSERVGVDIRRQDFLQPVDLPWRDTYLYTVSKDVPAVNWRKSGRRTSNQTTYREYSPLMAHKRSPQRRMSNRWLWMMVAFLVIGVMGADPTGAKTTGSDWSPFGFMTDSTYSGWERVALIANVIVALLGLGYALMLVKEVWAADTGTPRMQEIARAVREGAMAYLKRQFTTVAILIVILTGVLIYTANPNTEAGWNIPIGRGVAFLIGSTFSALVGFCGMYLATDGNLRVAAAARESFGKALQIGYRTGTVTGMLTDGLGLLGGSLIFLYFGERAYEALLGFGFGGTLLALFMRVGGGIYTKAADVGADLVGKIEANIPEDDPRNAATIADNVGDNVGDCAGMAADIFESYEVTIVAAMILGYASFGHKGVIFPLLVRAIGVIGSIISTYTVRAGDKGNVKEAMRAVNRGFWLGSALSIVGFMALGFIYLRFDESYIVNQALGRGLYADTRLQQELKVGPLATATEDQKDEARATIHRAWKEVPEAEKERISKLEGDKHIPLYQEAQEFVPLKVGLDMRAAYTCFIGIILAIALNFCTEYWTGTEYSPVKSLAKSCRTGHATNIIQGIAVGYESTVWAVIIIAAAILGSVVIYSGTNPIFIAFGVAMCGIGMLTLTGNTISMDVFGPVADNANGIGEMGYNKDTNNRELQPGDAGYMPPEEYKRARQILADLDAVGNTTKAITKGIAIGSAVIAAVSLFASFIAVMSRGSEEGINLLTAQEFNAKAALLTVADPNVLIGMLIGGAVPFLFSSMTIRAVGRAAYLIVQECRAQFKDAEIWAGTKKPNYGRVVDICTATAQKELIGPGLLAIFTPVLVGFAMGPLALGGFLAGMIVVGQLLAVFMANSGGAWDNAKKTIEDQPKTRLTGKGSETHKASVTGDTVGDPLKDTAGPAINPLIKVMNMVSLLVLPLVIEYNIVNGTKGAGKGWAILFVAVLAVAWSWWQSKRESREMQVMDAEFEREAAAEIAKV